jgi:hypothetical protein
MGDLPLDPTRPKLPPVHKSPGPTLTRSEQRARRWRHRLEYLKQELSSHAVAFLLIAGIVGFFALRYGMLFVLRKVHHG